MLCDDFFYVVQLEYQGDFCMADEVVRQIRTDASDSEKLRALGI